VKDRNGDQTANLMTKDEAGALRNIAKTAGTVAGGRERLANIAKA
jgi:hypothetical protein